MYKLKFTKTFEKNLKKLSTKVQKAVTAKKVQGLDNVFEMSVNMDIRILWQYDNGIIILLLDIGHHKDIWGL